MKTIVLVDGNPLMWRAAYAKGEYYISEGIITFFFDIVARFEDCDALLFWDKGKSRWRSEFYPEYKEQRQERKDKFDLTEISEQKKHARKVLGYFGVRDIILQGVEADDLISWFSDYLYDKYDKIIVATKDHDLWQLANDKVSMYDPLSKVVQDYKFIVDHTGIQPKLIADYKALVGDVSDNIKGVKSVGPKTAMNLIKEFGGLGEILKPENHEELKKKVATNRVLTNYEDLSLSYKLVKVPSLKEMPYFLSEYEKTNLKEELLKKVEPNPFKAMTELDVLGNTGRIKPRYLQSLDELVEGFGTYLDLESTERPARHREIDLRVASCARCPLRVPEISPYFSEGNPKANIFVLTSKIMLEDSRNKLELLFEEDLDLSLKNCWISSASRCFTIRPLSYGEVKTCGIYALDELRLVKPKLVIAIGDEALSLVSEYNSGSSNHAGEIFFNDRHNCYVAVMPGFTACKEVDWQYGAGKLKEFFDKRRANK